MSTRAPGYYWVRIGEKWRVAHWIENMWTENGQEADDTDFDEIGPKIEPPDTKASTSVSAPPVCACGEPVIDWERDVIPYAFGGGYGYEPSIAMEYLPGLVYYLHAGGKRCPVPADPTARSTDPRPTPP